MSSVVVPLRDRGPDALQLAGTLRPAPLSRTARLVIVEALASALVEDFVATQVDSARRPPEQTGADMRGQG